MVIFFQKNVHAVFIDEILAYYRSHDNNMTKSFSHMLEYTISALDNLESIIFLKKIISFIYSIISVEEC